MWPLVAVARASQAAAGCGTTSVDARGANHPLRRPTAGCLSSPEGSWRVSELAPAAWWLARTSDRVLAADEGSPRGMYSVDI